MDVEGSAWEFFFIDFAVLSAGKFKFNRIGACEGMKYLWKIDVSGLWFENWPENDQSLNILTSKLGKMYLRSYSFNKITQDRLF